MRGCRSAPPRRPSRSSAAAAATCWRWRSATRSAAMRASMLSGVPRRRLLHPQGLRSQGRPHGRHHRRADQRGLLLVRRRSDRLQHPRGAALIDLFVYGRLAMSPSAIAATASSAESTSARRRISISTRPTCSSRNTSERSAAARSAHRERNGTARRPIVCDVYRFESPPAPRPAENTVQSGKSGYALCSYPPAEDLSMWNKDEVKGKAEEVKGKAKQAAGDLPMTRICGGRRGSGSRRQGSERFRQGTPRSRQRHQGRRRRDQALTARTTSHQPRFPLQRRRRWRESRYIRPHATCW